jgi:hypothetical protein
MTKAIRAADLRPGMWLTGYLPAVLGIRTEGCNPVVKSAERCNDWIHVTWIDGSDCQYHPDEEIWLIRGGAR